VAINPISANEGIGSTPPSSRQRTGQISVIPIDDTIFPAVVIVHE
jgi:hypothetical protein